MYSRKTIDREQTRDGVCRCKQVTLGMTDLVGPCLVEAGSRVKLAAADRPPDVPRRRHQHDGNLPPFHVAVAAKQKMSIVRRLGDLGGHYYRISVPL